MATYLGGGVGIGGGGLVSMRPPSNPVRDAVTGGSSSSRNGGGGGGGGSSGGGSSGGGSSYQPSILLQDNQIIIDGVGYSVAPENQATFLSQRVGQYSAGQQAIKLAQQNYQKQQTIKQALEQAQKQQLINDYAKMKMTSQEQPKINIKMDMPFSLQPQIYQKQTGTFKAPDTGKEVPVYETRYYGGLGQGSGVVEDRPANQKEINYFNEQTRSVSGSDSSPNKISRAFDEIKGIASADLYQANVGGSEFLKDIGFTDKNIAIASKAVSYSFIPSMLFKPAREFTQSFVASGLKEIRDKPFTNVAIYGASYGAGFLAEGAVIGLNAIPKVGKYAGVVAKTTMSVGEIGLGVSYVGATLSKLSGTTYSEAGSILGSEAVKGALIGFGYSKGKSGFETVRSIYNTKGREFLETKQGEYPQASANSHLSLFKKNVIPELSDKPGAFHTTEASFWKKTGVISPKAGSSELPGLYGSTQVSTPFARIAGSGSSSIKNVFSESFLKSLFVPSNSPAIAFLTPEGFRYSPTKNVRGYSVDESFFTKAFKNPAKKGYADVPGIKSEIEAVFRKNAGDYKFQSGMFYTEIKGVRVPIDVFDYGGGKIKGDVAELSSGTKLKGGKSSYSYPESLPRIGTISDLSGSSSRTSATSSVSYLLPSSSTSSRRNSGSSSGSSRRSSLSSISSISSSVSGLSSGLSLGKSSNSMAYPYKSSGKSSMTSLISGSKSSRGFGGYKRQAKGNKSSGSYAVFARRFGKFKPIATGVSNINKAFDIGTGYTKKTLGASFLVKGAGSLSTPKGYYSKREKVGTVFIQKNKLRLSSFGEKTEIKGAKRRKRRSIF